MPLSHDSLEELYDDFPQKILHLRIPFFFKEALPVALTCEHPNLQSLLTMSENKSLVLFQAGPVQPFIAAARSTRDLWSGSYMLSWLMASAAKALIETAGTSVNETIVFPQLSELGVYKLQTEQTQGTADEILLNPAMPNRFLAIVPADKAETCAKSAEKAFREEFKQIANAVWESLKKVKNAKDEWKTRWDKQVELLPEITWQTLPIEGNNYETAYKRCQELLAARRNTRNFVQFVTDDNQEGTLKDALTGKEEIIGDEKFQKNLFPEEGPYGAISIIKRFWHEEYLGEKYFKGRKEKFYKSVTCESVPDIAQKNKKTKDEKETDDAKNPYIAVIAMDGDQMGKWMDGERRLAGSESDLELHHKVFSGKLAIFSNECAGNIVRKYNGQLVYAGGDDVLAMLPATKVFDCVCKLREKFQKKVGADKSGALADVSCGIAIAHEKYPLQRMVKEAQAAEKRAKNDYGRGAFAFSLLKHGGEIVHWGAKWDSKARECFKEFCKWQEKEIVSGRFPYALAGLLAPYALEKDKFSIGISEIKEILKIELATVVERQVLVKESRSEVQKICGEYIEEIAEKQRWGDFVKLFLSAAFIYRKRD